MITTHSLRGRAALMAGHCAGMVDLVALPVWVGALVAHYRLDPQQAGMLASLFLVAAVVANLVVEPRFNRLSGRLVAVLGFGWAACGFAVASTLTDFVSPALAHALCGLATGAALSVTHGTLVRSAHPRRLFALLGMALGVFAILFMAATPGFMGQAGGPAMFRVFAGMMLVAAAVAAWNFPRPDGATVQGAAAAQGPIPRAVWFGIVGISCMTLVQAMTFGFLERVDSDRGFSPQAVNGVLVALALVALVPLRLAAVLEKRLVPRKVMLVAPLLQALVCMAIMGSSAFMPYAVAVCVFAPVLIFPHVFAFGLLERLDPSGRAMAATPAMLMVMFGATIGPFVGGTLVKAFGYASIGHAALAIAAITVFAFSRLPRTVPAAASLGFTA